MDQDKLDYLNARVIHNIATDNTISPERKIKEIKKERKRQSIDIEKRILRWEYTPHMLPVSKPDYKT